MPAKKAPRCDIVAVGAPGSLVGIVTRRYWGMSPVLACDLLTEIPTVTVSTPVRDAVRLVAIQELAGLIVVDDDEHPMRVLPGAQVLRLAVPAYCLEDPILAHLVDEASADAFVETLGTRTVGQCLGERARQMPVVGPEATVLEIASLMACTGSELVAVVDAGVLQGAVSLQALLDELVPG
ncbi:CBS domain-containing protein [Catellatospora sichuanensis]|uniref:CBS domain-containing protein n=1 Tax=Catellatospora sichuanensis TaxID=1969805 RepID=UPI001FEB92BE|nr:CBS domain-containing protein [Catellatospora sichuanensis]